MKAVLMSLLVVGFVAPAMASQTISCVKSGETAGEGMEAVISGKNAQILVKGEKVADLVQTSYQPSLGGDQVSVTQYSQQVVNGYGLEVKSGGYISMVTATVLHDGVAGMVPLAELNDCK